MPGLTQKVLVIGAGGYLGNAIGCAYLRHGWVAYGLSRNKTDTTRLAACEIIPIIGNLDDPTTLQALKDAQYFNVIAISIDQARDFVVLLQSIIELCRSIAHFSAEHGVRPLLLFTSGLKDFGETGLEGEPGLQPMTEESPFNPPEPARERAFNCQKLFEHSDAFDAVVLRPSNLYGFSGSIYGHFFTMAEKAVQAGILEFPADAKTILHSLHVEDCAEAYVALSKEDIREEVRQQLFNIAGSRYETLGEIAAALAAEYDITADVRFRPEWKAQAQGLDFYVCAFSEWTTSDKIRRITGWTDKRLAFAQNIRVYRQAFEAARAQGHPTIEKTKMIATKILGVHQ